MTLTGGSGGFESPWTAASDRLIRADAQLLQTALRKAVSTSPEAFFTTLADLKARSAAGWEREIRTSSWAVLEAGDAVVGIAAAKPRTRWRIPAMTPPGPASSSRSGSTRNTAARGSASGWSGT